MLFVYIFTDDFPGEGLATSFYFTFYVGLALLVTLENRRTRTIAAVYDLGFLFYLFMPLLLPYYLYKSRGVVGLFWLAPIMFVLFVETIGYEIWVNFIYEE